MNIYREISRFMFIGEFIKKQTNYQNKGSIAYKTRNKRIKIFNEYFERTFPNCINSKTTIRILDVGGVPDFWKYLEFKYLNKVSITSLNLEIYKVPDKLKGNVTSIKGSATDMSEFEDNSFDLAFSNSVIEHVGDFNKQKLMANEMCRVAKHVFLQTPNKYFFMEPHFLFPWFQLLPQRIREEMVYRFSLGHFPRAKTYIEARNIVESVHLISKKELELLFPVAKIKKEKWLGMTKSFIIEIQ